jgi:hypothetical protein
MNYLLSQSDPTEERYFNPKIKRIAFDWEICNKDGHPYDCSIHYEVDERSKEVYSYGATFHYGFSNGTIDEIKESLKCIVRDLEGAVEFLTEPIVE